MFFQTGLKIPFFLFLFIQPVPAYSALHHKKHEEACSSIDSPGAVYLTARIAYRAQDFRHAASCYKRLILLDPSIFRKAGNDEISEKLTLSLLLCGKFDEAVFFIKKNPLPVSRLDIYSVMALMIEAFKKGDHQKALDFSRIMETKNSLAPWISFFLKAWVKFGSKTPKVVPNLLQKTETEYRLFALYQKALMEEMAGLPEKAYETYSILIPNQSASLGLHSLPIPIMESMVRFLVRHKKKMEAQKVLESSKQRLYPPDPAIKALEVELSTSEFLAPVAKNPIEGLSESFFNIAMIIQPNDENFARIFFQYALALFPQNERAVMQLAELVERQKDFKTAIALYQRIRSHSPFRHIAKMRMALDLAELGKTDQAIASLEKMIQDSPDDLDIYFSLGKIHLWQHDFHKALVIYNRAIARIRKPVRENWEFFFNRGIAYKELQEWPKAEHDFHKALELFPDHAIVMNYLSYSWAEMNLNLDQALKFARTALVLRPQDPNILDSVGWIYFHLNRFEESVPILERAVSLRPDDPVLNSHLGDAYWRVNRRREATFQWRSVRDMNPDPKDLQKIEERLQNGLPANLRQDMLQKDRDSSPPTPDLPSSQ